MDKMWCRNNLGTIGKWGGVSFLFGVSITAFVFGGNFPVSAYVAETVIPATYQPTPFKIDLNSVNKINDVTAPVNNLINSAVNSLKFNISTAIPLSPIKNISQNVDFSRFFSSSRVSSNDIMSFLKEAAVTTINLTIVVISITSQVLKGLLSIFNK